MYKKEDDTKYRKGLGQMGVAAEQTVMFCQSNHCQLFYVWRLVKRNAFM